MPSSPPAPPSSVGFGSCHELGSQGPAHHLNQSCHLPPVVSTLEVVVLSSSLTRATSDSKKSYVFSAALVVSNAATPVPKPSPGNTNREYAPPFTRAKAASMSSRIILQLASSD